MTRTEHVKWCKQRAHEYLGQGDLPQALASMMSDMGKHPETGGPALTALGAIGLHCAMNGDAEGMRRFIDGFN